MEPSSDCATKSPFINEVECGLTVDVIAVPFGSWTPSILHGVIATATAIANSVGGQVN
jgi:hypothetical protein